MATVVVSRGKRATPPPMPRGDLLLESPPELPPPAPKQTFGAVLRFLPLLPIGDLIGIVLYVCSFFGSHIQWRGERFRLLAGGRLAREE